MVKVGSIPERVTVKGENRKDFEPTEPLRSRMVVVVTGPHMMKCLRAGNTCTNATFLVLIFH